MVLETKYGLPLGPKPKAQKDVLIHSTNIRVLAHGKNSSSFIYLSDENLSCYGITWY